MRIKNLFASLVVLSWILTACQSAPIQPTPTATRLPTETPVPTNTRKPTATNTPIPTATIVPELGKSVISANWEFTLIAASLLKRGVKDPAVGGEVLPNDGTRFVATGFKVKPNGSATTVNTQKIVILDENGQVYGAYYLGTQDASQEIDPFSIGVQRFMWMIGEEINITAENYVHMIFEIPSTSLGKDIFFKFDDVPAIPFTVE